MKPNTHVAVNEWSHSLVCQKNQNKKRSVALLLAKGCKDGLL